MRSMVEKKRSHLREYLNYHEQTIGRNMNIKGTASEVSDRHQEHVIGNCRKGNPC